MGRLIRRTQEILIEEYVAKQEMRCPMHFCIGQEGTPTALAPLLRRTIHVSHYRSHGYYLAKGAPLKEMIAEFHGKATGCNGGFAGSMELAHEGARIYSGAIVGGPIAIAMGIAFALKYRGEPGIVVAVVGDGSLDEGVSYEAFNMAALHGVPLLTICENNLYAAHTPAPLRTMSRSLTDRVKPFGMRVERFDGMDIVQLHGQLGAVIEEMRSGGGPRFIEIETYRFCGQSVRKTMTGWTIARPTRSRRGAAATRCRRCATKRCASEHPSRLCSNAKPKSRAKSAGRSLRHGAINFPISACRWIRSGREAIPL